MGSSNSTVEHNDCVFCNIINVNRERIVYENEQIVIFPSRSPISHIHLLSVSKCHIVNINALTVNDLGLLDNMKSSALNYIKSRYPEVNENNIIFGFHVPPFNSVLHLHMHCLVPPYRSCMKQFCKVTLIMRSYDKVVRELQE